MLIKSLLFPNARTYAGAMGSNMTSKSDNGYTEVSSPCISSDTGHRFSPSSSVQLISSAVDCQTLKPV